MSLISEIIASKKLFTENIKKVEKVSTVLLYIGTVNSLDSNFCGLKAIDFEGEEIFLTNEMHSVVYPSNTLKKCLKHMDQRDLDGFVKVSIKNNAKHTALINWHRSNGFTYVPFNANGKKRYKVVANFDNDIKIVIAEIKPSELKCVKNRVDKAYGKILQKKWEEEKEFNIMMNEGKMPYMY